MNKWLRLYAMNKGKAMEARRRARQQQRSALSCVSAQGRWACEKLAALSFTEAKRFEDRAAECRDVVASMGGPRLM